MENTVWRLRSKTSGQRSGDSREQSFSTEAGFVLALQTAYQNLSVDLVGILPNGYILTEASLRQRFPPK